MLLRGRRPIFVRLAGDEWVLCAMRMLLGFNDGTGACDLVEL